jgi:hypothetical protein
VSAHEPVPSGWPRSPLKVRKESIQVNAEFAAIERAPDA